MEHHGRENTRIKSFSGGWKRSKSRPPRNRLFSLSLSLLCLADQFDPLDLNNVRLWQARLVRRREADLIQARRRGQLQQLQVIGVAVNAAIPEQGNGGRLRRPLID